MKLFSVILCLITYCFSQEMIDLSDTLLPVEPSILSEPSDDQVIDPSTFSESTRPSPAQSNNQPKGTLHIVVKPDSATVFINGRKVGKGSLTISNLSVGNYNVYVASGEYSEEQIVSVIADHVRKVEFSLGRNVFFSATSSFSQIWVNKTRTFGPSLDVGLKIGKQYFGLNYHWNFLGSEYYYNEYKNPPPNGFDTISYGETFGGAAFQWYYDVYEIPGILTISPGFCSGFWISWTYKEAYDSSSTYSYSYYDYVSNEDHFFFGGASVRISAGYKYVFANAAYTVLFGTTVGHALVLGIRVIM